MVHGLLLALSVAVCTGQDFLGARGLLVFGGKVWQRGLLRQGISVCVTVVPRKVQNNFPTGQKPARGWHSSLPK